MAETAQVALENLRLAIHGVTAPFSCAGTFVPDKPVELVFKDRSRFAVVRAKDAFDQTNTMKPLFDHCKPAPFGDGKKTRYDRRVRDALQLKAEEGGFRVENFDPESAGILQTIRRELLPHDPNSILAELYTVNVYTNGGHFAPHKDTPRGNDMFGTLVVCLPSQFTSGTFVLSHRGVVQEFDWGRAIQSQKEPNQLHWAAFFGDVDHRIDTVWSGTRVTLTYLLRRGTGGAPSREATGEDLVPRIQESWRALLTEKTFLPKGGILGYPCCHLYHQDARFQRKQGPINKKTLTTLKGRDHLVAATALEAGLNVTFNPYMFENCTDETWQLERFPTSQEESQLDYQMDEHGLEEVLPIRAGSEQIDDFGVIWLEPPPSSQSESRSKEDRDPELPAAAHLHSCDYCPWGYFGNESSEVDFYTFAALHFSIPKFGQGLRKVSKPPTRSSANRGRSIRKKQPRKE